MKTPAKLIFWRFSGVFLLFNFCGGFKKFGRRFFLLFVILRSDGFVFVFRLDFAVCGSFLCVKLFHLPPNVILTYEIFRKRCPTRFPLMKFFARLAQRVFCLWNFCGRWQNVFSLREIISFAAQVIFGLWKFSKMQPNAFLVCEKIRMCFPMRLLFIKIFANAAQRVFRQ